MEDAARHSSVGPVVWDYSMDGDRLAMRTVLLVEDDRDIREMLVTLLDLAGFASVACDTAEAGLNALREEAFDLILTDYALPRHSGLWLLEHAEREGLIQDTPVLIVTAHPQEALRGPYEIIQKPFDLDELVERARSCVEGGTSRRRRAASPQHSSGDHGDPVGGSPECPGTIELILYVNAQSPQSVAAVTNVKKVLARLGSSRVKLTVHDLSLDPSPEIVDPGKITAGTLVRKTPGPRTFILGHITSPELLLELLADCESEQH
jgi:DNA-binding response OmpR family regulator